MLRLFRWLLILASLFNFTPHRSPIEGIRYWVSEWGEHRSVCKYLVTNLNGLLIREGKCYSSLHKGAQESQCRGSSAAGPWMTRNDTRPRWSLLSSPPGECRHPALAAVTPVLWFARAGRRGGSVQCRHWSQSERGAARVQSSPYKQSQAILFIKYHYQAVTPTASVTLKRCLQGCLLPAQCVSCQCDCPQRCEWSVGEEEWGDI